MKKNILFLITLISTLFFYSCNFNENFEGLDEMTKSTDVTTYEYTLTDADITSIVKSLNANKNATDSLTAKSLTADKAFSVNAPVSTSVPYLLKTMYYGANKGSAAKISYKFKNGSSAYYALTAADYTNIWGNSTVNSLTPAKSAASVVPGILKTKNPKASEGDVRIVEYQYSATEPTTNTVEIVSFNDDFEAYTAGSGIAVPNTMYVANKDLVGKLFWQCRLFNNNKYAQASANNSGTANEIWMITNKIDLSGATDNASISFDVNAGYYNADCLSINVSENFDGTEAGIATATWTDITSSFTLPKVPASGYGVLTTTGKKDFKAFAGKKVYVAFKYTGNGNSATPPLATTTFQLDNIKISYEKTATSVPATETRFAYFKLQSGTWTPVTKTIYQLTAEDYTSMGVTNLTTATAQNYVPTMLKMKYPYAQEGTSYLVVFKPTKTTNSADEYILKNGVWSPVSFVETKTDQFVFSGWDVSGWVFDPTLRVTMKKGKEATDDYMMIVNYVKEHFAAQYPTVVNAFGDAEYYYGAAAFYGNISLRESDRLKDPTYAALTTAEQKDKYLTDRTQEALAVYLSLKFPNAQPQVSGIDVYCFVTTAIYDGVTTTNYVYKYQRVDAEPKWKFIERVKQ